MSESGLRTEDVRDGDGPAAQNGDTVTISLTIRLNHGDIVYETEAHEFILGKRRIIAGIEKAILGMRVGGERKVRISPHLAYRDQGVPGKIPPNAVLVAHLGLKAICRKD